jgi:hypothetical protein
MLVVMELEEPFLPLPDELLVNLMLLNIPYTYVLFSITNMAHQPATAPSCSDVAARVPVQAICPGDQLLCMCCVLLLLQMLVVTELEEPFLPLPDELLVNLKDSRPVVEALLDALPSTYSSSTSSDSAMGPALQVSAALLGLACAACVNIEKSGRWSQRCCMRLRAMPMGPALQVTAPVPGMACAACVKQDEYGLLVACVRCREHHCMWMASRC